MCNYRNWTLAQFPWWRIGQFRPSRVPSICNDFPVGVCVAHLMDVGTEGAGARNSEVNGKRNAWRCSVCTVCTVWSHSKFSIQKTNARGYKDMCGIDSMVNDVTCGQPNAIHSSTSTHIQDLGGQTWWWSKRCWNALILCQSRIVACWVCHIYCALFHNANHLRLVGLVGL